jgi:hypothetical protein
LLSPTFRQVIKPSAVSISPHSIQMGWEFGGDENAAGPFLGARKKSVDGALLDLLH